MKTSHTLLFFLVIMLTATTAHAQSSRRYIEKISTESIQQLTISGRAPSPDLLDSLANNAEVSIEMVSRMGEPDDQRQSRACMLLIEHVVNYANGDNGRRYVDVVRKGLVKSIDRSYDSAVRISLLQLLSSCAKPADVAHIVMYMQDPELAPTAFAMLCSMPYIDETLKTLEQSGNKDLDMTDIRKVMDARVGKKVDAPMANVTQPKPEALPFWTESLDYAMRQMSAKAGNEAISAAADSDRRRAFAALADMAGRCQGADKDAVIAKYIDLVATSGLTGAERYLLLRRANELKPCDDLRRKIIVDLGSTDCIQSLGYLWRWFDQEPFADAAAVATTELIASQPEANGGRHILAMLYAAKQSFIRHYDERGADIYIDNVLDALDRCGQEGGYRFSSAPDTRMETRGFWNMYDDLNDFDMAFDWQSKGTLTVSLHSMPVLQLDSQQGARLAGDTRWHKFQCTGDWSTAFICVNDNRVTVCVNGQEIFKDAPLVNSETGKPSLTSGHIKFLADDNGAVMRQFTLRKK